MGFGASASIPIIPLAKDSVLLPGVTLRIPVSHRLDIPTLLSAAFPRAAHSKTGTTTLAIGCVPLKSSYLGSDGRQLLEDPNGESTQRQEHPEFNPAKAKAGDLFGYGCLAKIIGVQGRSNADPYLLVEGLRRFRIDRVSQERPFFQSEVTFYEDEGNMDRRHTLSHNANSHSS